MRHLALWTAMISSMFLSACVPDKFNTDPEVKGLKGAAPVQTLVDPKTNASVSMRPGGMLRIKLDANATTGYFWQIKPGTNDRIIEEVSSDYVVDDHPMGMVGVGGTRVFEFIAKETGKTVLKLGYSRAGQPSEDTRVINIDVAD